MQGLVIDECASMPLRRGEGVGGSHSASRRVLLTSLLLSLVQHRYSPRTAHLSLLGQTNTFASLPPPPTLSLPFCRVGPALLRLGTVAVAYMIIDAQYMLSLHIPMRPIYQRTTL
ncbi:hypothetical protein VTH06DRAFT_1955 [Thermothelomyces fergusii]